MLFFLFNIHSIIEKLKCSTYSSDNLLLVHLEQTCLETVFSSTQLDLNSQFISGSSALAVITSG